jgi:hypothetical protein
VAIHPTKALIPAIRKKILGRIKRIIFIAPFQTYTIHQVATVI